jgi:ribosomal protein L37E
MSNLHYVCDRCGNYWQAERATECPECEHAAIWEFGTSVNARAHSAHVKRIAQSRLLRERRR